MNLAFFLLVIVVKHPANNGICRFGTRDICIMKKQKKLNQDIDVSNMMAGITNGTEFRELKNRLADIAAKTRFDNLVFVQPSLVNDLLNTYKEAGTMISNAAKLNGSGPISTGKMLKDFGEAIAKYSATGGTFNSLTSVGNFLSSFPPEWMEGMKRTSERLPDALILMSNASWPLDYDVTPAEAVNLADMLDAGKKIEVDEYMTQIFENSINDLFTTFYKRHPIRTHILKEILKCYEQEMYHVAISNVLSQIDGICNDFTSNDFFRSSHQKPNVTNYIVSQSGGRDNWLLGPISKVPPVGRSVNDRKEGDLNRHSIMHGIDITYGNKINFFKSIAWLKYLSDVLWFDRAKNAPLNSK